MQSDNEQFTNGKTRVRFRILFIGRPSRLRTQNIARAIRAGDMANEGEKYRFPIILLGFRSPWQESESPRGYRIMN